MMETSFDFVAGKTLMSPEDLQQGMARLSRGAYFGEASLDMMLSILAESAASICGVERASIWALTEDQRELRCLALFEHSLGRHSSGNTIDALGHPVFFRALRDTDSIAVDDVYNHPLTAEFVSYYLPRHRITALLATPIHIRGELQGLLSLEQVASRQPWATAHQIFAQAVANLVALALAEYEAYEAKKQAQLANEQLHAVINASPDALLIADGVSGKILDVNRQAEQMTGCSREELLGRHQRSVCGDGVINMAVSVVTEKAELSNGNHISLNILRAA